SARRDPRLTSFALEVVSCWYSDGRHAGRAARRVAEEMAMASTVTHDTTEIPGELVEVGPLDELREVTVVSGGRHGIAVFAPAGSADIYAVDNRCPHMGFPLHKGTVCDGILTCHWHHARFDLASG